MQISKITRRSAIALSVAAALTLAGCGDKEPAKSELVPVGIVQLVEHSALDACTKGVKDALAERGYKDGVNIKIDFQNAQGDQSNLHNIATRFVSNKDKLIFAVATPAAQAVATTAKGTPIVATAITDFVAAKLVKSDEQPGGNVTGVSDLGPIEAQLELLLKLVPDAKAVGTIYNSSEINSKYQVDIFKKAAEKRGVQVLEATVSNVNDIQQAAASLNGKVQGMWLPTDNVLASAIPALAKVANPSKIPVIAGERGMTPAKSTPSTRSTSSRRPPKSAACRCSRPRSPTSTTSSRPLPASTARCRACGCRRTTCLPAPFPPSPRSPTPPRSPSLRVSAA